MNSWQNALLGGVLIGTASLFFYIKLNKILGVSGLIKQALIRTEKRISIVFIAGLLVAGWLAKSFDLGLASMDFSRTNTEAAIGGLLVGLGAALANGCTSGHGICGVSRFSPRSILAILIFIFSGAFSVFIVGGV